MKVLVTGAGGYLGVVLLEKLLERGHSVRALDSFYWGEDVLGEMGEDVEIVHADIRSIKKKYLKGIDAVCHFAGISTDPMAEYDPKSTYEINTDATVELAELCKKWGVEKFTFASSASIYDRGLNAKTNLQTEKSRVYPRRPYSVSKFRAEKKLAKMADERHKPVLFRHGTVYGYSPRMRFDLVVNTMFKSALQTGSLKVFCGGVQWRPLIDVNDIAMAHILAIESEKDMRGEIINLVYKNYRMIDLAKIVKKTLESKLSVKVEIEVDKTKRKDRSYRMSGAKAKKMLGWEPKVSVEESLENLIKVYKDFDVHFFSHPRYYNIEWFNIMKNAQKVQEKTGRIF